MVRLPRKGPAKSSPRAAATSSPGEQANEHLTELLKRLRNAYRNAGEPSYRAIAKLSGGQLSASTISRMFRATKPPKWRNLSALLTTLGVQPGDFVTIWHPLWAQAQNKIKPIDPEGANLNGRLVETQAGMTCAVCGAIVGDANLHRDWHRRVGLAASAVQVPQRNAMRAANSPARPAPPARPPARTGQSSTVEGPLAAMPPVWSRST